MATGEVTRRQRGFTLIEVMVTVAIVAILVALASNALNESRRVARVNGQARLLVQRLQTVRTNAVSQGNAQGYLIGPNGIAVGGPDAHQCFVFIKQNPVAFPVLPYDAVNDTLDPNARDELPRTDINTLVTIRGAGGPSPGRSRSASTSTARPPSARRPRFPTASRSATLTRPPSSAGSSSSTTER